MMIIYVPWSKVAILGMVIPPFNRNPYNGYIHPYYWVDDHPLLYGNNGSLDPGTYDYFPTVKTVAGFGQAPMHTCTWRIMPVGKWLITMVGKSPKDRVVRFPNGLVLAYKWGVILTGMILQVFVHSFSHENTSTKTATS